jgi:uncharacterized protein with PQ loop repeat
MTLALVLGWLGTACVVGLNLPQVWRSCVQGRTQGLPASRFWVALAVSAVWLGYGLYGGGLVQVVLNSSTLVLNTWLLAALPAARRATARWAPVLLATAGAVVVLGQSGGREAVGLAGAAVGTGVYLPQLLALRRHHHDLDGVSRTTLWLQGAGGSCWLGYGALRAETVVWVPNVFVLLTTAATLVLLEGRTAATLRAQEVADLRLY